MTTGATQGELEKEAARFLERDFNQCFQQARHYDAQNVDLLKFAFTTYAAVGAGALGVFRYGLDKGVDYRAPAVALLLGCFLLGVLVLATMVRNRVYFVAVTRYLNEHRGHFLGTSPLGFQNATGMYVNPGEPAYFHWRSSQALGFYFVSTLNAALLGIGIYVLSHDFGSAWSCAGAAAALCELVQVVAVVAYLESRNGKAASASVGGGGAS